MAMMLAFSNFLVAMGGLFGGYLVGEIYMSLSIAIVVNVANPKIRALRNF